MYFRTIFSISILYAIGNVIMAVGAVPLAGEDYIRQVSKGFPYFNFDVNSYQRESSKVIAQWENLKAQTHSAMQQKLSSK